MSSLTPSINATQEPEDPEPINNFSTPSSTMSRNQVDANGRESIELHAVPGFLETTGDAQELRNTELSAPRPYKRKSDYKVTINESANDVNQGKYSPNSLEDSGEGFPNANSNKGRLVFNSPRVVSETSYETQNERIENADNLTTNENNISEINEANSEKIADENQSAEVELQVTSNSDIQPSRIESTLQVAEF